MCIDTDLLVRNLNLDGDRALARRAVEAVVEAFATATPSGKRNSYNHHACAGYIRAEAGDVQPRSLAGAFLKPVTGEDLMAASVDALETMAGQFDHAYGPQADACEVMNVGTGAGTLHAVKVFVSGQIADA